MKIEYRVRPVTRYIVTRFHQIEDASAGVEQKGEYNNADVAFEVAYALCRAEHEQLGYPIADERIQYPTRLQAPPPSTPYPGAYGEKMSERPSSGPMPNTCLKDHTA